LKKLILILFIAQGLIAQTGYVDLNHNIYSYLELIEVKGLLKDYDSFQKPISRRKTAQLLARIESLKSELSTIEKEKLSDFLIEFEYDINNSLSSVSSLHPDYKFENLLSNKEKYLFAFADGKEFSIFVNILGETELLSQNSAAYEGWKSALLYSFGGNLRASISGSIGFQIRATNGSFFGNKNSARLKDVLEYNYKFNKSSQNNSGNDWYDHTIGNISFENQYFQLKLGRDNLSIGYGSNKEIISDNSPPLDYILLNTEYKSFTFQSIHARLLGDLSFKNDPIAGNITTSEEKYLAYHRLSFTPFNRFRIGIGETIIYSRRSLDLSYLNPIVFYKSVEHLNQDRDNAMLFADLNYIPLNSLQFYSTFLIDDFRFSEIGNDFYGNRTLFTFGIKYSQTMMEIPFLLSFQYIKTDPYLFSHRIHSNNYSHLGYPIGPNIESNSHGGIIEVTSFPRKWLELKTYFEYYIHGSNTYTPNGKMIVNRGGSIEEGFRIGDSEIVEFLGGNREDIIRAGIRLLIEPLNNYFIRIQVAYQNKNFNSSKNIDQILSSISLSLKF